MRPSSQQLLPESEQDRGSLRPSRAERHQRRRPPRPRPRSRRTLIKVAIAVLMVGTATVVLLSTEGLLPGEFSGRRTTTMVPWSSQLARALGGGSPSGWTTQGKKKAAAASSTKTQLDAKASGPLKPVLGGLLDNAKLPASSFRSGAVSGFVLQVDWSELQSAPGAPLAANNPIDQAIAAARATGMRIKLRVDAGTMAPDWAKSIGGPPVTIQFPNQLSGALDTGTIGRFWTEAFGRAYQDLQNKLAARYDNVPEIAQTSITRCMTFYAEPFLRQARTVPQSARALLAAGYTWQADEICQKEQVQAATVWKHTRSGLAFNPYQRLQSDGSVVTDETFTEGMMRYCRGVLGARCVLENHSIRTSGQSSLYPPMYAAIRSLGGAISFQTAAPARIGDLLGTISWAAGQGASSIEMPISYRTMNPASFVPYNSRLLGIARAAAQ